MLVPNERESSRDLEAMRREAAPLVLRIFLLVFLVYLSYDEVFDPERLEIYANYLESSGITFQPMQVARFSAYAQFAAGILLGFGLLTRLMSFVMIVHFLGAILLLHMYEPLGDWLVPCAMLSISLFLWLNGPGDYAVSRLLKRR